ERLLEIAAFEARSRVVVTRVKESRVELDCSLELLRRIGVALFHREPLAGRHVSFRRFRIKLQRALARFACFLQMRFVIAAKEMNMGRCQAGPGAREIWIKLNRSLKHLPRELDVLARPFLEELPSAQIEFVR